MWYDGVLKVDIPGVAPAGLKYAIHIDRLEDPVKVETFLNTSSCDQFNMDWDSRTIARVNMYSMAAKLYKDKQSLAELFDMTARLQDLSCPACGSSKVSICTKQFYVARDSDGDRIMKVKLVAECTCGEMYDLYERKRCR